jgi:hypothetical protein
MQARVDAQVPVELGRSDRTLKPKLLTPGGAVHSRVLLAISSREVFMKKGIARLAAITIVMLVLSWTIVDSFVLADQLTFSVQHYPLDGIPLEVRSGDFNGDGVQDLTTLIWASPSYLSILYGDGLGGFSPGPTIELGIPASEVTLVIVLANTGMQMYHINGDGTVGVSTNSLSFNNSSLIAVADFDLDGHLDLVAVGGSFQDPGGGLVFLPGDGRGFYGPIRFMPPRGRASPSSFSRSTGWSGCRSAPWCTTFPRRT